MPSSAAPQGAMGDDESAPVVRYTRVLSNKTYLKRMNVPQYMSDHLLPHMEGSMRGRGSTAAASTAAAARAARAAKAAAAAAAGDDDSDDGPADGHAAKRSSNSSYRLLFRVQIQLVDSSGKAWPVIYEGTTAAGQRHLRLTCGWSEFIKAKRISIGDAVTFERRGANKASLAVAVARAGQEPEQVWQGQLPGEGQVRVLVGQLRQGPPSPAGDAAADEDESEAPAATAGLPVRAGGHKGSRRQREERQQQPHGNASSSRRGTRKRGSGKASGSGHSRQAGRRPANSQAPSDDDCRSGVEEEEEEAEEQQPAGPATPAVAASAAAAEFGSSGSSGNGARARGTPASLGRSQGSSRRGAGARAVAAGCNSSSSSADLGRPPAGPRPSWCAAAGSDAATAAAGQGQEPAALQEEQFEEQLLGSSIKRHKSADSPWLRPIPNHPGPGANTAPQLLLQQEHSALHLARSSCTPIVDELPFGLSWLDCLPNFAPAAAAAAAAGAAGGVSSGDSFGGWQSAPDAGGVGTLPDRYCSTQELQQQSAVDPVAMALAEGARQPATSRYADLRQQLQLQQPAASPFNSLQPHSGLATVWYQRQQEEAAAAAAAAAPAAPPAAMDIDDGWNPQLLGPAQPQQRVADPAYCRLSSSNATSSAGSEASAAAAAAAARLSETGNMRSWPVTFAGQPLAGAVGPSPPTPCGSEGFCSAGVADARPSVHHQGLPPPPPSQLIMQQPFAASAAATGAAANHHQQQQRSSAAAYAAALAVQDQVVQQLLEERRRASVERHLLLLLQRGQERERQLRLELLRQQHLQALYRASEQQHHHHQGVLPDRDERGRSDALPAAAAPQVPLPGSEQHFQSLLAQLAPDDDTAGEAWLAVSPVPPPFAEPAAAQVDLQQQQQQQQQHALLVPAAHSALPGQQLTAATGGAMGSPSLATSEVIGFSVADNMSC